MKHIRLDKKSGHYFVRFRYGSSSFNRSLKTNDRREANAINGRVTETLMLLERGRLEIPTNADPAAFILSDGKRQGKPIKPKVRTLSDLFRITRTHFQSERKSEIRWRVKVGTNDF